MLHSFHEGGLEVRQQSDGSTRLRGRFPYGVTATLSDGGRTGRPQKEQFAPRAFSYNVEQADVDIHLLSGHSYDRPLASRGTGTLSLKDTTEALLFDAVISREVAETAHGKDTLALIRTGLAVGVSPGFRIPPERAVPNAETVEEEPNDGSVDEQGQPRRGAIIRTIMAALLFELSIVTRPAYTQAQVEARNWQPGDLRQPDAMMRTLRRWRP